MLVGLRAGRDLEGLEIGDDVDQVLHGHRVVVRGHLRGAVGGAPRAVVHDRARIDDRLREELGRVDARPLTRARGRPFPSRWARETVPLRPGDSCSTPVSRKPRAPWRDCPWGGELPPLGRPVGRVAPGAQGRAGHLRAPAVRWQTGANSASAAHTVSAPTVVASRRRRTQRVVGRNRLRSRSGPSIAQRPGRGFSSSV